MVRSPLYIAFIQFDIQWEDPLSNREKIEDQIDQLSEIPDLLILPEMFTTGFTMNVGAMAESMDGESVAWLLSSAKKWKCEILGSLIIEDGGNYYNRLLWVDPEGIKLIYDKRHLFGLAGEDQVFTAGRSIAQGEVKGWKVKPLICYDLRFPVWSRNSGDTDVLIYIANFPEKRRFAWRQLLVARAIENQCFVLGVNRVGWDGKGHYYSGDSVVIDPHGAILLDFQEEEGVGVINISDTELEKIRHELPFLLDADQFEIEL